MNNSHTKFFPVGKRGTLNFSADSVPDWYLKNYTKLFVAAGEVAPANLTELNAKRVEVIDYSSFEEDDECDVDYVVVRVLDSKVTLSVDPYDEVVW